MFAVKIPMKPGSAEWFDTTAAGRPKILILGGYSPPAKRAGGPTRSVFEMVRNLPQYAFYVYCRDREFGTREKLPGIIPDVWQAQGTAWVCYASFPKRTALHVIRLLRRIRPDVIYVCSFFAREPTMQLLFLRRLGLVSQTPIILAPRGEFSPGSLSLKPKRKRSYLAFAKSTGFLQRITWHACSHEEVDSIGRVMGKGARIVLAPNFPVSIPADASTRHVPKQPGVARLVFLSRISPEKNLLGALAILSRVSQPVSLDIYGPVEDAGYWNQCVRFLPTLPPNATARFLGPVDPDQVNETLSHYDVLFLPTLGENYGYVIVEAWASATPVLVSDRTPWKDLESTWAGWSFPLESPEPSARQIDQLALMGEEDHARWRDGALNRARMLLRSDLKKHYESLFGFSVPATDGGRAVGRE